MNQPNFSTSNTTDADYSVNQQSSDMNGYNTGTDTGKSLSEALIFASIDPQYDDRLFMELP